jgi:Amt family ammonium transporter
MCGGVMAFVVAQQLGPRQGKYGPDGSVKAVPGHSVPLVVLGTFILAFGWFGFNPGSTLSGSDTRIAVIAVNTMLASAAGAMGAYVYTKVRFGAPDVSMLCNGMLAGLVAITAPCAFVTAPSAILIGLVAGVLVIKSALFVEQTLRVDDPVGAVSVHGVCGAWGILALGLLSDGRYGDGFNGVPGPVRGLLYGDTGQFFAGCIGIVTNVLWVGGATLVALKVIGALVGNRSDPQHEIDGLDLSEMGGPGYAPDALAKRRATPSVIEPAEPTGRVLLKSP